MYANNPEKSSTTKTGEHNARGYLVPTIWAFDYIENKPIIRKLYIAQNIVWKTFVVLLDSMQQLWLILKRKAFYG